MNSTANIQKFLNILEKDPKSKVFVVVADIYRRNLRFSDAIILCENGIKYNPDFTSGYLILGRIYFDMGELQRAKNELSRVISQIPDNIIAISLIGNIAIDENDLASAKSIFDKLTLLNPRENVAKIFVEKFRQKTWNSQSNSKQNNSNSQPIYNKGEEPAFYTKSLARVYEKQGMIEEAINVYSKILEKYPSDKDVIHRITSLQESLPIDSQQAYFKYDNKKSTIDRDISFLRNILIKIDG